MPDVSRRAEFDSHAAEYSEALNRGLRLSGENKEFFARGRLAYLRDWWENTGRREPSRILDWGCGIGDVSALLAAFFPSAEVQGVDPSPVCVERARDVYGSERVSFSVLSVDGGFHQTAELIHLNGVVHHVPKSERKRFFRQLRRALAPNGVVALFENNPFNLGTRLVMSRIPFDRDAELISARGASDWLTSVGLRRVDRAYLFYFPRALAILRPLERLLRPLPLGAQYVVVATAPDRPPDFSHEGSLRGTG